MTRFDRRWRDLFDQVVGKDRYAHRLWWLTVGVYPKRAWLGNPADRCSLCREMWYSVEGAIRHVTGIPHFRRWCMENPVRAASLWGERVRVLLAEEALAGEVKP